MFVGSNPTLSAIFDRSKFFGRFAVSLSTFYQAEADFAREGLSGLLPKTRGERCEVSAATSAAAEGLCRARAHCDGLMSLEKSRLTDYVGELSETKKEQLDKALQIALSLPTARS